LAHLTGCQRGLSRRMAENPVQVNCAKLVGKAGQDFFPFSDR
jgi:hypothetical protein